MKTVLITDLAPEFLIQGFSLNHAAGSFTGKVGRHEVELLGSNAPNGSLEGEVQVISLGLAQATGQYRPGDILMMGSDDLLDRAFQALDEMEQRGLVVNLPASEEQGTHFVPQDERLFSRVQSWKNKKLPFLCLCTVEPVGSEEQAKLVALVRKVIS